MANTLKRNCLRVPQPIERQVQPTGADQPVIAAAMKGGFDLWI